MYKCSADVLELSCNDINGAVQIELLQIIICSQCRQYIRILYDFTI